MNHPENHPKNQHRQFTEARLLREVVVDSTRSYFDTNTSHHHHFFCEESQRLMDIPGDATRVENLPAPPDSAAVRRIDVVVRVGPPISQPAFPKYRRYSVRREGDSAIRIMKL